MDSEDVYLAAVIGAAAFMLGFVFALLVTA